MKKFQYSPSVFGAKYLRMDQAKIFNDCLPQNLLGPFLNTLSYLLLEHYLNQYNTENLSQNIFVPFYLCPQKCCEGFYGGSFLENS